MGVFSRTVGKENTGIIVRNYEGKVLSVNSCFLELAGVPKNTSSSTVDDFPWGNLKQQSDWGNLKQQSDAADVLAKSGDVREMVSLYFHPTRQQWVHAVSVKFSHQSSSSLSGRPLEWEGQPVIYILMMDVSHLSRGLPKFKPWATGTYVDFEKERVVLPSGRYLSRNDLICLSYYLENFPQSAIAETMSQSIKTVEKRIAALKSTLHSLDPSCTNLYELCRNHGIREMLEMKRDWFDKRTVAAQITNMQWQGNHDMLS